MSDDVETVPPARETRMRAPVRIASLVFLLVGAALVGGIAVTCADRAFTPPAASETTTVVRSGPDVIVAMRDLARLETAQYQVERVVELRDQQRHVFGLVEAEDAILLVASGEVTAGVDLSQLEDDAVVVDHEAGTAVITLPAPEILVTRLDNDRTYVHSRQTDALARRSLSLETRARQEAERTLAEAATEGRILDKARTNAERTVRALVHSLGYDDVEVRFEDE